MEYITQEIIDFKKYLKKNGISGIALDIDNTLSNTTHDWYNRITQIAGNPENITFEEFLKKYHLIENAPYYQTKEIQDLLVKFTDSPDIYKDLLVIDNSSHFVNQVNQILPIAAYITMRPEITLSTTQEWLDKHDFPKAKLISRPNEFDYNDAISWKSSVLEELYPNIIGIVDDSLGIAKKVSPKYKGKIYLYNCDIKNYRTDIDVFSCPNWSCVLDKIKADFIPKK